MTASDDIRSVWEFPPKGTLPDLAPLLEARDPEAMAGWIAERHRVFARGVEASHRRTLATLEKDLAAKGVPFEVDRTLGEQAMAAFDDMEDAVFDLDEPEEGWAFRAIPLAMTRPTDDIPFDYDDLYAATGRLRNTAAQVLAAGRGVAVQVLALPETAFDVMDEDAEWDEAQEILSIVGDIAQIVPPADGKPGFALTERQEDGGLPVEIDLLILEEADYARLCALVAARGGRICPHPEHDLPI